MIETNFIPEKMDAPNLNDRAVITRSISVYYFLLIKTIYAVHLFSL